MLKSSAMDAVPWAGENVPLATDKGKQRVMSHIGDKASNHIQMLKNASPTLELLVPVIFEPLQLKA